MLTIEIFNSGSAFDPDANAEAARILREFANRLEQGNTPEVLRDSNGNQAGTVYFDPMTAHTESGAHTMTKREAERQTRLIYTLATLGFSDHETAQMRRISNTLHNWFELECGNDRGYIERDPETEKPYFVREGKANTPANRRPVPDRETGARKRLAAIMSTRPHLNTYVQTDPRGAALYILRPDDVPAGKDPAAYYSRGICVY